MELHVFLRILAWTFAYEEVVGF